MKALLIISALLLTSCTDAFWDSNVGKLNKKGSIKCYSGNTLIYEGKSTGAISNARSSDGYQFRELGTDNFMEVSGNCIIKYDN
jgi:hypothetical protein